MEILSISKSALYSLFALMLRLVATSDCAMLCLMLDARSGKPPPRLAALGARPLLRPRSPPVTSSLCALSLQRDVRGLYNVQSQSSRIFQLLNARLILAVLHIVATCGLPC